MIANQNELFDAKFPHWFNFFSAIQRRWKASTASNRACQ